MKPRITASLIHLGLSALVAVLAALMVFMVWYYPTSLAEAVGVTQVFLTLLCVDISLGPLMTLVIYNPQKKSLKMDIAIIVVLQIAALSYGMTTVFEGRPVFVVFAGDRFTITRALDINPESAKKAQQENNQAAQLSWLRPRWVGAEASKDVNRRNEILFSSVQGGADWPQLPELFVPLDQVKNQILQKAHHLNELPKQPQADLVDKALAPWRDSNAKWLPLQGRAADMIVLVEPTTAEVVGIVNADPWP